MKIKQCEARVGLPGGAFLEGLQLEPEGLPLPKQKHPRHFVWRKAPVSPSGVPRCYVGPR